MSKTRKTIATVVVAILLAGVLALYAVQVLVYHEPFTKNLSEMLFLVLSSVVALVRIHSGQPDKRGLSYYGTAYSSHIKSAFTHTPKNRKKLLVALRHYSMGKYDAAIKSLKALLPLCEHRDDHYAVYLFLALSYSNQGLHAPALEQYEEIRRKGLANSTVYSNMSLLYQEMGQTQEAYDALVCATEMEPNNEYAHNNLATFYFRQGELEEAIVSAKRALEINGKMYQASTLLAIIYAIQGDREQSDTYKHKAIASGQNAKSLKAAIRQYTEA